VQGYIKRAMTKDPHLTTDQLMNRLEHRGLEAKRSSVAAMAWNFKDTLHILKQHGVLGNKLSRAI